MLSISILNFPGNPKFILKLCVTIRRTPLGFFGITFCVVVRFWCPVAEMKATDMPLHVLLDLSKNIYFSKSYSRKLFVIKKTQLDFHKNIFKKKTLKKMIFQKNIFRFFWWKVNENRKFQNYENLFLQKYFQKIKLLKTDHKTFSAVTFRKINIFI